QCQMREVLFYFFFKKGSWILVEVRRVNNLRLIQLGVREHENMRALRAYNECHRIPKYLSEFLSAAHNNAIQNISLSLII
ncbi:hypothetical protein ACJX0J_010949, partial [Zea mays]